MQFDLGFLELRYHFAGHLLEGLLLSFDQVLVGGLYSPLQRLGPGFLQVFPNCRDGRCLGFGLGLGQTRLDPGNGLGKGLGLGLL